MNPIDWDAILAVQRNMTDSMENSSITNNEGDSCGEYSRHTVDEAQSSMGVNVGWKGQCPPSHNFYINESEVEDPDGEPLEMDQEDPELARKQQELREIEERIMLKKAAIALKTVELRTTPADFSCNEQSAKCKGAALKDRVNVISQQRHPGSFLSKVWSPKGSMNSSRLSKDCVLQNDHPLKLRVKALMKQRCSDPCVSPGSMEVLDVTPPPPCPRVTSPANDENGVNQGFQRFLSVLNKGVDMDFLSRIVNDDSEDLPSGEELLSIQPSAMENKSDPAFRNESQQSNSGALLLGHSQTNSGERKTDPASQEGYLDERLSLPDDNDDDDDDDEEKKNARGDRCFASNGRSKSPSEGKKKKRKEEKPKVDEQHEQLQNILKTLGLNMEVEEMSKLADRTQERLYGKKHKDTSADSRRQQERRQSGSQRHYSHSSSSRSTRSRSPSRHRCSHSTDSKQRSEHIHSRDGSRDGLTRQDDEQDSKEARRYRDKNNDGKDSEEISTYQHPYPQNPTYPHPHPAAFSAFPDYSLSQDSQYTAYDGDTYSAATHSYWALTQGAIPPSLYPSGGSYPVNTFQFPGCVGTPNMVYPHHNSLDINSFVNPDLSKSEGQTGSVSAPRYLQVISTKPPTPDHCLKRLTNSQRRKRGNWVNAKTRRILNWRRLKEFRKLQRNPEKQSFLSELTLEGGGSTAP